MKKFAVAGPDQLLFQAIFANFNPNAAAAVDPQNGDRAPLLLISGGNQPNALHSLAGWMGGSCRLPPTWAEAHAHAPGNHVGILRRNSHGQTDGKRALITGGASGIGFETLRQFVVEGARVAITARCTDAFEPVRREFGDSVLCIASDAGDAPGQKALAEVVRTNFGGLDVLFVNAGIADLRPVEQWTERAWDHCFQTNVRGPFFLIQALLSLFANPHRTNRERSSFKSQISPDRLQFKANLQLLSN